MTNEQLKELEARCHRALQLGQIIGRGNQLAAMLMKESGPVDASHDGHGSAQHLLRVIQAIQSIRAGKAKPTKKEPALVRAKVPVLVEEPILAPALAEEEPILTKEEAPEPALAEEEPILTKEEAPEPALAEEEPILTKEEAPEPALAEEEAPEAKAKAPKKESPKAEAKKSKAKKE